MVTVLTIVEIVPGRDDVWQQVWNRIHPAYAEAEGFHSVRLWRDADHPERYVILAEWDDRDDYNHFVRHIGLPWLKDTWEFSEQPSTVIFLQDAAP